MAESPVSDSEMTISPAENLENSKLVVPIEEKTIVGGISELVTVIKNGVPTLPLNCKLVVQGSQNLYKLNRRVTIIPTISLTITVHKN